LQKKKSREIRGEREEEEEREKKREKEGIRRLIAILYWSYDLRKGNSRR